MTLQQLVSMLGNLRPKVAIVEDCFVLDNDSDEQQTEVRHLLETHSGDSKKVEMIMNRRFVVSDLLDSVLSESLNARELSTCAPDLVLFADVYVDLLRGELSRCFPQQEFDIEADLADIADEPLEGCVTFSRRP